ncbi:MAG: divalent cation transporter [Pirellulaceae bacterium]|nr:MAG: divalent cation transporter [Pirellulaceae bacterium]
MDEAPSDGVDSTRDNSEGYDLETLLAWAFENNPAIHEAEARVEAAQGRYVQVGLPPNPAVGYSGQQLGSRGQAEQQGVLIEQELVTGGKLRLLRRQAAWEVARSEHLLEVARQRTATDVRTLYFEALVAQRRIDVAEKLAEIAARAEKTVKALYDAQEASLADYLQAQIETQTARVLAENAHAEFQGTWQRLVAVAGRPDLPPARLRGDPTADWPEYDPQRLLDQILAANPQLLALEADVQRARWAVDYAHAAVIPNIQVQGIVQDDRATGSSNGALQVTVPVPLWNRNQGGIQQAWGELSAAQQAVDRVAFGLRKKLAETLQSYQVARQQAERYRDQILPKAAENLQLAQRAYEQGEFTYLQLLTAQRTYFQTELNYLDALGRLWRSANSIDGLLLSDSLETDPAN